jgi:TolA-binding protein
MRARLVTTVVLALAPVLGACAGTTQSMSGIPTSTFGTRDVIIPNAPAGDTERRGIVDPARREEQKAPLTPQQSAAIAKQRREQATALWDRAVQTENRNPKSAAKAFRKIVDDYPDYERAAEAKFREGRAWYAAYEDNDAVEALQVYMRIAPVNPHLAEVEKLIYDSAKRGLTRKRGLLAVFKSDDIPLAALDFVARTFPAGAYADDALMTLGDYYLYDTDYATAALHYKELLLRYPDSEWSFKARLRLGDTYFARDQGDPYSAGFVDIDPREGLPAEQAKMFGAVLSAMDLARVQYETYLERMEADPARLAEYREDVAYARRRLQESRERLAAKDLDRGDWYAARGERSGAISYWRQATRWPDTRAGAAALGRLSSVGPTEATPRVPAPAPTVAPTDPRGTAPSPPPPTIAPRPQPVVPPTPAPSTPPTRRTYTTPPPPPPPPPPAWPGTR